MAVEKVKFINIIGPLAALPDVLDICSESDNFHMENASEFSSGIKGFVAITEINPYTVLLSKATELCEKLELKPIEHHDKHFELAETEKFLDEALSKIKDYTERLGMLKNSFVDDTQIMKQIVPLINLKISLKELYALEYVDFRFGRLTKVEYEKINPVYTNAEPYIFIPTSTEGLYVWGFYFVPTSLKDKADATFSSLHFERIRLSDRANGIPSEVYEMLTLEEREYDKEISLLEAEFAAYKSSIAEKALETEAFLWAHSSVFELRKNCIRTTNTFFLAGWLAEDKVFAEKVESIQDVRCVFEEPNSDKSMPIPPTKLKNFTLFRPFEQFVTMYGLPRYGEIDPTPLVAISYSIIFGLMFGDIGQGLCLFIAGLVLALWKKMQFGKIIATVGLFATAGGFLYGSVFGYELHFGLKPLENTGHFNIMMIGSIVIGVSLIIMVIIINIINAIKRRELVPIFSHNGIAGLVFYVAVIVAVLGMMGMGKNVLSGPYIICFVVVPLLVVFFKEPLARLIRKRRKLFPEGAGGYILENAFEMIEILLSYVTNTISFVRIGAFALNHAGMMMFVFIIARMSGSSENIAVVIIGNIVVMALEGLIVGIQVLRLEFYEIFGRFFSGDGRDFIPVSSVLKKPKE